MDLGGDRKANKKTKFGVLTKEGQGSAALVKMSSHYSHDMLVPFVRLDPGMIPLQTFGEIPPIISLQTLYTQ